MFLSSLLSAYAVEQFEPFAKWISVGVIALLLIVGAVIFFIKKPIFGKFVKYAFFGVFLYLLALAVVFFALDIAKNYSDSYAEKNWLDKQTLIKFVLVPLLVLSCVCLISLTAFGIVSKFATTKKRLVGIIGGTLSALALNSTILRLIALSSALMEWDLWRYLIKSLSDLILSNVFAIAHPHFHRFDYDFFDTFLILLCALYHIGRDFTSCCCFNMGGTTELLRTAIRHEHFAAPFTVFDVLLPGLRSAFLTLSFAFL